MPAVTARLARLGRVVEVVAAQPQHVAVGDAVAARVDVDKPHPGAAGLRVHQAPERDRHELARLDGDHGGRAAGVHVARGAEPEVAGVVHVHRDRVGAAQLVADVLGDDGRLHPELAQPRGDGRLERRADVYFRQAHVVVRIPLGVLQRPQIRGVDGQDQPFRQHGHAVGAAGGAALDDGAGEDVDERLQADPPAGELLGYERQGGARRLADAERQVPRLAAHGGHEVPARCRLAVDHQVLDDLDAVVPRGLKAEGVDVRRQVQVVVDRLRDMHHAQAPFRLLHEPVRGVRRVVAGRS